MVWFALAPLLEGEGGTVAGYLGISDRWLGLSYHLTLLLSPKYLQKCGHSKKCPPGRTSCCSQRMKGQESWLGSSKHIILSQLSHLNKYILSDKNPIFMLKQFEHFINYKCVNALMLRSMASNRDGARTIRLQNIQGRDNFGHFFYIQFNPIGALYIY